MTLDAPFHLKSILLKNSGHIVDLSMTGRATYTFRNVNAVIKIRVLGQIMNPFPFDRLIIAVARTHWFEIRAVGPDLTVAVHTGLRWRHSGGGSRLHRRVTVATVNAIIADMVFMAELHRLLLFEVLTCQVR